MNKCKIPPCKVNSHLPRRSLQIMSECEEEVGTRSPFGGSVASDDRELELMRVFPRAALSRICSLSPIRMWSSKKEKSAWGECWRRSRHAIVELKKPVKEIALLITWAAWTKRLDSSLKCSRLLTFCDVPILC